MKQKKERVYPRGSDRKANEAMRLIIGNDDDNPKIRQARAFMTKRAGEYSEYMRRAFEMGHTKHALEYAKRAIASYRSSDNYEQALDVASYVSNMAEEYGFKNPLVVELENLRRKVAKERRATMDLATKLGIAASIISILGGVFFSIPIITGKIIANISLNASRLTGATLFILGILGLYYFTRIKKR